MNEGISKEIRQSGLHRPERETLTGEARRAWRGRRLGEAAITACNGSAMQRERFRKAGLDPGELKDIRLLGAIEVLPLSGHLAESPGRAAGSGDSALAARSVAGWGQALFAAGARPDDIVLVGLCGPMSGLAMVLDAALSRLGCRPVPGGVCLPDLQVEVIRSVGASVFVGTGEDLIGLIEAAARRGLQPAELRLEVCFIVNEPIGKAERDRLEAELGAMIRHGRGTNGTGCLGFECAEKNGWHVPDDVLLEIIDPATGRAVESDGAGEIAATVFDERNPLIRVETGLRAAWLAESCSCGRTNGRWRNV